MAQEFFTNLPREITIKILSSLPFETIMRCKCVQKSWLTLTEAPEFFTSYFSQKPFSTGLAFFENNCPKPLKILEFLDDPQASAHPCRLAMKFSFSFPHHQLSVHSSVNGLLLMINSAKLPRDLYICNPITCEYFKLPASSSEPELEVDSFGFGVSRVSGQYKVVRMFREFYNDNAGTLTNPWLQSPCKCECEVFTIEPGSWRTVVAPPMYVWGDLGVFLNGSLHWLVRESERFRWILCFDLETEVFTTFAFPLHQLGLGDHNVLYNPCLCVLEDRLCLSDNSGSEIAIWLMNEYGDEQSWRKDFAINKWIFIDTVYLPIKVYRDGDVLMAMERSHKLFLHSSKTGSMERIDFIQSFAYICSRAVVYSPSFLPLRKYTKENSSLVIKPTETEMIRLFMSEFYTCVELVKGKKDRTNSLLPHVRDFNDKLGSDEGKSSTVKRVKKSLRRCSKCKKMANHDARNCGKMLS